MTEEDLDKELDSYLYQGDDGEERRKSALDDELDSYFAESEVKDVETKKIQPVSEKKDEENAPRSKEDDKAEAEAE